MSVKGLGVTTGELEYFIENAGDNISKNFVGVFPADHKHRFHEISSEIRSKGAEYLFMIVNTDAEDKPGTQIQVQIKSKKKKIEKL